MPEGATVWEFECQYTNDVHKKRKTWHDGKLRFHESNSRFQLYSEQDNVLLGSEFVTNAKQIEHILDFKGFGSEEHKIAGRFLVIIQEFYGKCTIGKDGQRQNGSVPNLQAVTRKEPLVRNSRKLDTKYQVKSESKSTYPTVANDTSTVSLALDMRNISRAKVVSQQRRLSSKKVSDPQAPSQRKPKANVTEPPNLNTRHASRTAGTNLLCETVITNMPQGQLQRRISQRSHRINHEPIVLTNIGFK
ncbi:LAMI_0B03158g1_1 [Lachancea mirantina]|uniref:LAMI_0B03158g1_1 n=1 Tax=Lachancea mirantina TaxID=1230905 RepID=A0A1G4IUN2_9SACH|nr:LAMI_0B03158g1_1 [Lachancea mirantina]